MTIFLGTDHAGFHLKEEIKKFLTQQGYQVEDCGAYIFEPEDDYPDFIFAAAKRVAASAGDFGVVLGKSGSGECIAANKVKGIRAILGVSVENVILGRKHNDANILCLGSDFVDIGSAKQLLELFLTTPFSNEARHLRRIAKIQAYEK